jgi:bacillithiol system protein YtxJ
VSWFSTSKKNVSSIPWVKPVDIADVQSILSKAEKPVLFFKHSTRCSISAMALDRMEREWTIESDALIAVYIDVLTQRNISNFLAEQFNIPHQSPQVLLINNGKCVHNASHNLISVAPVLNLLNVKS